MATARPAAVNLSEPFPKGLPFEQAFFMWRCVMKTRDGSTQAAAPDLCQNRQAKLALSLRFTNVIHDQKQSLLY